MPTLAPENCREANRRIGTIGSSRRRSTGTNTPIAISASTPDTMTTGSLHPPRSPSVSAITVPPIATTPMTPPAGSNRRTDSDGMSCVAAGTKRATITADTTNRGSPSANTHRHPSESTRTPPRNGPPAVVIAEPLAHNPIALPRSCSAKLASTRARLIGVTPAAPMPWTRRPATSTPTFGATKQITEPTDEHRAARHVDASAPEHVAGGPADEDQRGHRDEVAVDDPLQLGQPDVEILADGRERDVDDRRVEERRR